jgi:glutaryl-CoA dehydrogenase
MYPILAYGSDEQKNKWLPEMGKGKVIGCFGLTEADYGSNPSGMITTAKKDGQGFVLNGSKMWITNGGIAHIAIVWAKLDGRIRGFIVERGTPGYSTRDIHGKFSLRASVTSELTFQDCRIPASNILPNVDGLKGPLGCLNQARYGIAWGGIGAAMACYHEALEYSKTRIQFDRPIAGFQMVQEKLAWMIREITKGQLLALQVGRLKDAGKVKAEQVSLAKMNNVDIALQCARLARAILGANGITDEYQCGRHMCNLESVYTYEGTHDIHTLVIGEAITGIPAYK